MSVNPQILDWCSSFSFPNVLEWQEAHVICALHTYYGITLEEVQTL